MPGSLSSSIKSVWNKITDRFTGISRAPATSVSDRTIPRALSTSSGDTERTETEPSVECHDQDQVSGSENPASTMGKILLSQARQLQALERVRTFQDRYKEDIDTVQDHELLSITASLAELSCARGGIDVLPSLQILTQMSQLWTARNQMQSSPESPDPFELFIMRAQIEGLYEAAKSKAGDISEFITAASTNSSFPGEDGVRGLQ